MAVGTLINREFCMHLSARVRRPARYLPAALIAALGCLVIVLAPRQSQAAQRQGELTRVQFSAGWNIVAVPTGTELTGTGGPQYAFGPDGTGYVTVHAGEIVGGRAVWAYFPGDTEQELGRTAATYTRLLTPADQWE